MKRSWTFGQRIGAGLALVVVLGITVGGISIFALSKVVASKDRVINVEAKALISAQHVLALSNQKIAEFRAYLMTGDDSWLTRERGTHSALLTAIGDLNTEAYTDVGRQFVADIHGLEVEHETEVQKVVVLRQGGASPGRVALAMLDGPNRVRAQLQTSIQAFVDRELRLLKEGTAAATAMATSASRLLLGLIIASVILSALLAVFLTRTLSRQVRTAVSNIQSSSAELQAAANQQAAGIREQGTAMMEISNTINELLASARQIAESAQRVAQITDQAAIGARTGTDSVERAHESITAIRHQVDLIVGHMLDLGKKSQQIGVVLEMVSELAEQTNIVAINATIEAAGAGESGKRFAVVADEIRKLADRVATAAKEIRGLIEDVRGAVNTTVMATETGSKAVDEGSRQFGTVAESIKQTAALVATTTDAAREIELSTRQQSTAVEQVNVAVGNVAQTARESQASATQTLQTASELSALSRDLRKLVQSQAAA